MDRTTAQWMGRGFFALCQSSAKINDRAKALVIPSIKGSRTDVKNVIGSGSWYMSVSQLKTVIT